MIPWSKHWENICADLRDWGADLGYSPEYADWIAKKMEPACIAIANGAPATFVVFELVDELYRAKFGDPPSQRSTAAPEKPRPPWFGGVIAGSKKD